MREAQGLEGTIDRIVRYREPELLMQPHDQIARPPAHHAMDRSDRALLYDAGEKGLMNSVSSGDEWDHVHLPRLHPHLGQVAGRQDCGATSNGQEPLRSRAGDGDGLVSVQPTSADS